MGGGGGGVGSRKTLIFITQTIRASHFPNKFCPRLKDIPFKFFSKPAQFTITAYFLTGHCFAIASFFILSDFQHQITMTQYKKEFPFPVLFPPNVPRNVLAEWLSTQSVAQFHCAGMAQ